MSFQVESKTKVRVTSVSINGENHGKDIQPAVTLSLKMTVGNDWLANLSGFMKGLFFMKGNSVAVQPELPGTEQSDMPALRMPEIGSIPWTKEYTGLRLVIDHGIGGASDIVVTDCKADNIVLTMKEGGSAEVEFKLKSNTADEHTRGQLTSTIKRDIEVRIFGPDVDEQQDIAPAPPPAARKRKDATDAFVEQHGSAP
jgi:hypothetical protein